MKTLKKFFYETKAGEFTFYMIILMLLITITGCAQPVTIEQKESIKNALVFLITQDGTIYKDDVPQYGNAVNGVRYFETRNPLTKEQWYEVVKYLSEQGFKREQILILTEFRYGPRCPVICP